MATSYAALSPHPDARLAALGSALGSFLRGLPWFAAVMWLPLRFPDGLPPATRLGRFGERFTLATVAVFSPTHQVPDRTQAAPRMRGL